MAADAGNAGTLMEVVNRVDGLKMFALAALALLALRGLPRWLRVVGRRAGGLDRRLRRRLRAADPVARHGRVRVPAAPARVHDGRRPDRGAAGLVPRAGLNPDRIAAVAAEVADEVGLERLTLAMVASRLGVSGPALYKHVAGLDAYAG